MHMTKRTDLNVMSEASVDVSEHGAPVDDIELGFFVGGSALTGARLDEVMKSEHLPTSSLTQSW